MIHQLTRLQIMALLHKNREVAFQELRDALGLTEGNLGGHTARLVEAGYVESRHALTVHGFRQRYRLTRTGERRFLEYLADLRDLLPLEEPDPG